MTCGPYMNKPLQGMAPTECPLSAFLHACLLTHFTYFLGHHLEVSKLHLNTYLRGIFYHMSGEPPVASRSH